MTRGRSAAIYTCDKAISFADYRLDKPRVVGVVLQNLSNLANGSVNTLFGIDKYFLSP